jgi:N-methylhydantoinase A
MARALRLVTVRRGHDPRDFTLVAYGGAGPLHAALLARELGVARVVVPPGPGHFSAFGMLLGALKTDVVRTRVGGLDALAPLLEELEAEARGRLNGSGSAAVAERFAEVRYRGQEHTLEVPVADGAIDAAALARLRADFDRQSLDVYAFSLDAPLELVAARVAVSSPVAALSWDDRVAAATPAKQPRSVDFDEHGGRLTAEVVERSALAPGAEVPGPAIVEEPASTTLVLPGQVARADELGNLIVEERR